jgi:hypothetical protein
MESESTYVRSSVATEVVGECGWDEPDPCTSATFRSKVKKNIVTEDLEESFMVDGGG